MIVKNEEKNIERALKWAKDIAFEQIVVDTGSTDRTIALAERMGAKVVHFQWVNDFSKAKNFAIEQAKGEWIAFLDADEYFSTADTKKIMPFLKYIMADSKLRDTWHVIQCPWAQLDDFGKIAEVHTQERIFRNIPGLRYEGKIHEKLNVHIDNTVHGDDITIMHTGYTTESIGKSEKIERNIRMLKEGLKENPENINYKGYLADALRAKSKMEGSTEQLLDEIDSLYNEVINSNEGVMPIVKKNAYISLLTTYTGIHDKLNEYEKICIDALKDFPEDLDLEYFYAVVLHTRGKFGEAWELLVKCDARLKGDKTIIDSQLITANPELLYKQMELTAAKLNNNDT